MISQMYPYLQTLHVVYIKYVQFLFINHTSIFFKKMNISSNINMRQQDCRLPHNSHLILDLMKKVEISGRAS